MLIYILEKYKGTIHVTTFIINRFIYTGKPGGNVSIMIINIIVEFILAPDCGSLHEPKSFITIITKLYRMKKFMNCCNLDILHFCMLTKLRSTIIISHLYITDTGRAYYLGILGIGDSEVVGG